MQNVYQGDNSDSERENAGENSEPNVRPEDRGENYSDLQERFGSTSSEEEEDDISEVESFVLGEGEEDIVMSGIEGAVAAERAALTNSFILAAAHASVNGGADGEYYDVQHLHNQPHQFDPETQARLVALLEAAVSSSSDPEVLRQLTSSVSSALDEAAVALTRMRMGPCNRTSDPNRPLPIPTSTAGASNTSSSQSCSAASQTSSSSGNSASSIESNSSSRATSSPGSERCLVKACNMGDILSVRRLLDNGGDVNEISSEGESLLSLACASGFLDLAQILLNAGASVNGCNENGHTPLMEAASAGHVDTAKLLMDRGAAINACSNEFKESPLTLACYKGHFDMVRFLLQAGADQEHKTDEMHTALMEASMDGHVEVARMLLESGAQVNMPSDSFESPLTLAACGGHIELTRLLVEYNANTEEINDEGYTPLMEAAREGHAEVVDILLNHGKSLSPPLEPANIDALTEETQETALTLACCGGFEEVVVLLVKNGANMDLGSSTALMEAAQEGHSELVEFLVESGADLDIAAETSGDTALIYACENGHTEVVEAIVKGNANVEIEGDHGRTALMKACRAGHYCCATILLIAGADPNHVCDDNDHTALSMSIEMGNLKMVELLLVHGANPNHRLKDNTCMVLKGALHGHTDIVKTLIEFTDPRKPKPIPEDPFTFAKEKPKCIEELARPPSSERPLSPVTIESTGGCNQLQHQSNRHTSTLPFSKIAEQRMPKSLQQQHTQINNQCLKQAACSANVTSKMESLTLQEDEETATSLTDSLPHIFEQDFDCNLYKDDVNPEHDQLSPEITVDNFEQHINAYMQKSHKDVSMCHKDFSMSEMCNLQDPFVSAVLNSRGGDVNSSHACATPYSCPNTTVQTQTNTSPEAAWSIFPASLSRIGEITAKLNEQKLFPTADANTMLPAIEACPDDSPLDCACIVAPTRPPTPPTSQPSTSFLGSSPPIGHIPVQERRKLVPSKKQLDKRGLNNFEKVKQAAAMHTSRMRQQAYQQLQQCFDHTLFPTIEDSTNSIAPHPYFAPQSVPPHPLQPQHQFVNVPGVPSHMEPLTTKVTNDPIHDPQMLLKTDKKRAIQNCGCALQVELCKMKNPSLYEVNQLFDNMNSLETSVHLPNCPGVATSGPLVSFPLPEDNDIESPVPISVIPTTGLFPIDNNTHLPIMPVGSIIQGNAQNGPSQMIQQPPLGTCENPGTLPVPHTVTAEQQKYMYAQQSLEVPLKKSKKSGPNLPIDAPILQPADRKLPPHLKSDEMDPRTYPVGPYASESFVPNIVDQTNAISRPNTMAKIPNAEITCEEARPPSTAAPTVSTTYPTASQLNQLMADPVAQSVCLVDLNVVSDSNHDSGLTVAASGGHEEMTAILLEYGAEPNHVDKKGYSPLLLATMGEHFNICKLLIAYGADLEIHPDRTKDTPLCIAVSGGRLHLSGYFLACGANKEHRNVSDYTPLSLAASGGHVAIVEMLLELGAEINSRTGSRLGISPLMLAAMNGHAEVVKVFLEKGSDINAQIETNRNTALTLACFRGRVEVVRLLLEKRANIEHRAKTGLTPLMEAASGGFVEVGTVLLDKGADINAPPVQSSKDTALTIAADKGHVFFVEMLLDRGAAVEVKNKKGNSPLWLASNGGFVAVVKALVNKGANVDSQDNRGVSCLMVAFKKGHLELTEYMLDHVAQFPSESDLNRYMNTVTDPKLMEDVAECVVLIRQAKDKFAIAANKAATALLQQLDQERIADESRRANIKKQKERKRAKKDNKKTHQDDDKKKEPESGKVSEGSSQKSKPKGPKVDTPPVDAVAEERDGDSGIDSNSQTSASSEPKVVVKEVVSKNKKRKKKKEANVKDNNNKSQQKTILTLEEPPPVARQIKSQPTHNTSQPPASTSSTTAAVVTKKKKTKVEEIPPELDISVYAGMKPVSKKAQYQDSGSRMSALDTFGEPENHTVCKPTSLFTSISYNSQAVKPLSSVASPKKQMRRGDEEWKEVSRKAKKVIVPSNAISRVIGRGGCNINAIREASGAYIEVEKQGKTQGDRMVIIKGPVEATKQAQALINSLVNDPDKDLTELLPKTVIKVVPRPAKAYSMDGRSLRPSAIAPSALAAGAKGTIPTTTVSAWANVDAVKRASLSSKIAPLMTKSPAVRQLFPRTQATKTSFIEHAQTFASKLAEPKTKSTKVSVLDQIELESEHQVAAQSQQYSIFNNPLAQVAQDVTFGPRERKSFARAASGPLPPPKTPLGQPLGNPSKALFESNDDTPVVDASRAPGYRGANTIVSASTNMTAKPTLSPSFNNTHVDVNAASVVGENGRQLSTPVHDLINQPSPMMTSSSAISTILASTSPIPHVTVVTSLARSAPGTPIASPSMRAIRQTVTPPPMLNGRTSYVENQYSHPVSRSSSSPIPSLMRISTAPPQHTVSQGHTSPTMSMSNSYAPGMYMPSSSVSLTNLAPGGPVSSQRQHTEKTSMVNLAVGQPFRKPQPISHQLDATMQTSQQMHVNSTAPHPHLQQHLNHQQNQYQQQLQLQQQTQLLQQQQQQQVQHNYTQGITSISQLMGGLQFTTPQTNNQPIYTNNMVGPISATPHIQSSLNPNAPQFSSRADALHLQQFATRAPMPPFQSAINPPVFPGVTMGQYVPSGPMDAPMQMHPRIDMIGNVFQRTPSTMAAPLGFRPPMMTNQEAMGSVNADPTLVNQVSMNSANLAMVARPYMGGMDDRQQPTPQQQQQVPSKLQPIGTERAQKLSEKIVGRPSPQGMGPVPAELLNFMPAQMQSSNVPNGSPIEPPTPPQAPPPPQQGPPIYYTPEMEMAQYNNQQQWNWGGDSNP